MSNQPLATPTNQPGSPPLSVQPSVDARWARWAPALRARNFRLFWLSQLVSVIGTSVQVVAEGWLIYDITGSTFWLGMVGLLGLLPVLPISLVGGLLIDRFPRRRLILITQVGLLTQAVIFGVLATTGQLRLWQIIVLYFVFGALLAIDNPARRAFLVELVPADDLANAVALNATVFNMSSLVGFALSGVLIATLGAGPTMLFNGLTYLAPIAALLAIRVRDVGADRQLSPATEEADTPSSTAQGPQSRKNLLQSPLLEGAMTLLRQPSMLATMALMGVVGGLAYPVFGMMPAYAEEVLQRGAIGLGALLAAGALGSVIGTFATARFGHHQRGRTLVLAGLALPLLIALFALTRVFWLALVVLVLIGMALLIVQSLAITLVQVHIADRVRGRVMSIYSLLHAGSDTLSNVLVGTVAVWIGLPGALIGGAAIALLAGLVIGLGTPLVRRLD